MYTVTDKVYLLINEKSELGVIQKLCLHMFLLDKLVLCGYN